ncbi:MAG: TIGR03960 family B12-binding radical SAM protein [Syntrophales bacterium]|nr:TIGR03960 family B12-binding radical SAM protein [Syntrophales bacterium]HOG07792.1 TIGR03960 family B12-binding radical SAM protein [Syntrophales bacterium]HOS77829.1 TIGR03960 family B12-binding radical SAM protein [Syntrophales bacterium]HQN25557.1 TIGR03960 family B12-binding radical SAM protein [Syntrophales bacterium]HQP28833.1 TIGR03960 family B12-binding radical SAM protein [Syntrophales bacterium]
MREEAFLTRVEKPGRYLGGEVNAVVKDHAACRLSIALAFPDVYEVGMSHLGLQILYGILNAEPGVVAERCYAPWPDLEGELVRRALPLVTLESRTPLHAFDLVGFSLQYELSYTNVLAMLDLGGIPLRAAARGEDHPLVIAGGPCAFNPLPMSPFIDAFVIGEGEAVIGEIARALMAAKSRGERRASRLARLAEIEGVYCPALHTHGEIIRKRTVPDLNAWHGPVCPVVPLVKTIHDRLVLEIARGCTRGCRFCQAGMLWRPVRERDPDILLQMSDRMLAATGHEELSLLSLSAGDYPHIEALLGLLMDRHYARRVALALPSLRVETLTPRLMEVIRRVRKTSFTLAPEAGTQRLRDRINKGNTEADLMATAGNVFDAGWRSLKLYFMIGLPGEGETDLDGIVDLAHKTLPRGKSPGQVAVSLSTFVPKPHTPFQWERQIDLAETEARQAYFRRRLRHPRLTVRWHDGRMSLLEGLLSRGDERMGDLLERAYALGCRFDGWGDRFRFDLWEAALDGLGVDREAALAARPPAAALPWDRIATGVSADFLREEAARALDGRLTEDCRTGPCHRCGVCDHETIRIVPAGPPPETAAPSQPGTPAPSRPPVYRRYRLRFVKEGRARFLSHLELAAILIRAIRLAGLDFRYSEGFHPHPRLSFAVATSVGMESREEYADIELIDPGLDPERLRDAINRRLPAGIAVTDAAPIDPATPSLADAIGGFRYEITLPDDLDETDGRAIPERVSAFLAADTCPFVREGKGKTQTRDIRPYVADLKWAPEARRLTASVRFDARGAVRPSELLIHVLKLPEATAREARIVKTAVLGKEGGRESARPAQDLC